MILLRIVQAIFIGLVLLFKNIALIPFRLYVILSNKITELFRFSISFKINFVYSLIFVVVLLVLNLSIIGGFFYLSDDIERDKLKQTQEQVEKNILTERPEDISSYDLSRYKPTVMLFYALDKRLIQSNMTQGEFPFIDTLGIPRQLWYDGNRYILITKKLTLGHQSFYMTAMTDTSASFQSIRIIAIVSTALSLISLMVASAIGTRVSRNLLQPISKMTEQVKNISVKNLSSRLDVRISEHELKDLGTTINTMMERIELGYKKQNQFVSDASHELRTPISIIQGYIGMLDRWGKNDKAILEESIAAIKSEGAQMKELVEKLLFLARSDRGQIELDTEILDVKDIVEEVAKDTRMIDNTHEIICETDSEAHIQGSRKLIKQLIRIIVDNSIKFTPEGGTIKLQLKKSMKNIMLVIEDSGVGIPEEDIPFIFDRFYRSDKSRTKQSGGSGLGLSIAKWILDQHEGDVLVTSKVGEGTRTSLFFKAHLQVTEEGDGLLSVPKADSNKAVL